MFARKTFTLRVTETDGPRPFEVSLLLVKYGRRESTVIRETALRHARTEGEAVDEFVKLRDSVVGAGFPEWPGGHDLGPLDAATFDLRDDGLTERGARRALKHLDRVGSLPVLQNA